MKYEYYEKVVQLIASEIDKGTDIFDCDLSSFPDLPLETFVIMFKQYYSVYKQRNNLLTEDELNTIVEKYKSGKRLLDLSYEYHIYPLEFAIMFMGFFLKQKRVMTLNLIKNLSSIQDESLRNQLAECIQNDHVSSPYIDNIRHSSGMEYEYILQQELRSRNIPFKTEYDMRKLGMAKTPDILLEVPVSIQLQDHSWLTISWIDSKAMFGDPYWQIQHEEQLLSYVNRFGNGCVFYWFGFVEPKQGFKEIAFVDHFPSKYITLQSGLCNTEAVNT